MTKLNINGHILIVDDSPDALKFLTEVVEGTGATVLVALDGEKALEVIDQVIPDVILLDAMMPRMDGFETCRRLKDNPLLQHVPVIFMTGLGDTEHIVEGLQAGGVDYLVKPIAPDELIARMRIHLANAQLTKKAYAAMDEARRYLLATDSDGIILWSTPQAASILERTLTETSGSQLQLPKVITDWMNERHQPDTTGTTQRVLSNSENHQILISYIGQAGPNEFLMRIIEDNFELTQTKLSETFGLTSREAEVLAWIANGKSNRDIGTILQLSPRTINKHLEHIHQKLGVENRTSAAAMAIHIL